MNDRELVKALREDAEWAAANEWETPITLGDDLTAAADRLEALIVENDHLREATKKLSRLFDTARRCWQWRMKDGAKTAPKNALKPK